MTLPGVNQGVRFTHKCTQASVITASDKIEFRLLSLSLLPSVYKDNYSDFNFKIFSLLSWK